MRVYQSLVRSVKGESYEVFKRTVKREKICACDHCGTGGNRGVSVYILRISLAENCEISDLVVLGFIDSKRTLIPNQLLIMMLVARAMLLIGEIGAEPAWWKECLKSAFGGLGLGLVIFLAAWFLSRKSIGMGDVKLAAVIGWYLGGSLIWFDLVVCLSLSAIFSIVQLLRKKLTMKDSIPLAPFFSVGTILILIIGF